MHTQLLIRISTFICVSANPTWKAKVISEVKTRLSIVDSKYSAPMTIAEAAKKEAGMTLLPHFLAAAGRISVLWTISEERW